ncbi:MAG: Polyphosphate:AMP phosphotransferase [Bryobacteraceae bacterium]|nr:Polyphosphate:AMP phosphotransferase [Bryobacteraceae bacterium]
MLEKIDLSKTIPEEEYRKRIPGLRARLYSIQRLCWDARVPVVLVFEGWGASGRGAMVNFLTQNLEPRVFRLHMILSPRTYEQSMPWLWRFWIKIPSYGEMAIFDQSWYRRVLIERVEKRVRKIEWQQAFEDINDFERALSEDGYQVLKFFLHISRQEQKQRLKKQARDPISKLMRDPEDKLQLKQHDLYLNAVEEMLMRTETEWAPWTIVEAGDPRYARVKVFESIIYRLEEVLHARAPDSAPLLLDAAQDAESAPNPKRPQRVHARKH